MLEPPSSFTNDRHKWEDEEEDGKRVLVLFLGAVEDQNIRILLLPARWETTPE